MIFVVVGMHKSGTTLVSEILHKSGISMGEFDDSLTYDQGNQYERWDAFKINLDMFGVPFEDYFSTRIHAPPREPRPPESIRRRMRTLVASCEAGGGDWGFKDPLTALTYPAWSEVLPPHRVLGIYRDPDEVLGHYRTRFYDLPRAWKVLRAWCGYNLGLLRALDGHTAPSMLLRYDDLMRNDGELERLQAFVGRELVDARKPDHYRRRASGTRRFPAVERALARRHGLDTRIILSELDARHAERT